MKQLLIENGYRILSGCSCGGTISYTLTNDNNMIKIKPNRDIWEQFVSGTRINNGNFEQLKQRINEIQAII